MIRRKAAHALRRHRGWNRSWSWHIRLRSRRLGDRWRRLRNGRMWHTRGCRPGGRCRRAGRRLWGRGRELGGKLGGNLRRWLGRDLRRRREPGQGGDDRWRHRRRWWRRNPRETGRRTLAQRRGNEGLRRRPRIGVRLRREISRVGNLWRRIREGGNARRLPRVWRVLHRCGMRSRQLLNVGI